ncbi:hypothetical protein HOY80DRAFT_955946, partial [Tuber brumale]
VSSSFVSLLVSPPAAPTHSFYCFNVLFYTCFLLNCILIPLLYSSRICLCNFCLPRQSLKYPSLEYNTPITPFYIFLTLVFCTSFR